MKIRIGYTVEADDDYRRAIRRYYGEEGLATRAEVQRWCQRYGESMDLDLAAYYGTDATAADRQATLDIREAWDET